MEEYIDDLLRRMADEETEIWHRAYDEAKALNDLLTFLYLQQKVIKAKKGIYEERYLLFNDETRHQYEGNLYC